MSRPGAWGPRLRQAAGLARDVLRPRGLPVVMNYEVTARCNLRCEHCYFWKTTRPGAGELSDAAWARAFAWDRARGVRSVFLTGGEPALRPRAIRAAALVFGSATVVTNGTISLPRGIPLRVFASVDGPRAVHNRIRRADVFDRVMANIGGDQRVILAPTLSTSNAGCVGELVQVAREAGVRGITFSLYTPHQPRGDPLQLRGGALRDAKQALRAALAANPGFVFLTPRVIDYLGTGANAQHCFFRGRFFGSVDARRHWKRPCVLGAGASCAACGCIVPVAGHAVLHGDARAWVMWARMFPAPSPAAARGGSS